MVKNRILIVGSVNADIYVEIDRLPKPGETIRSLPESGRVFAGGKGGNQAVSVARLIKKRDNDENDARSQSNSNQSSGEQLIASFCAHFGDDSHGKELYSTCQSYNVNLRSSKILKDTPSGQALILLQKHGENSIILIGGANQQWSSNKIEILTEELKDEIQSSRAILLQREIPQIVNQTICEYAAEHHVSVYFDLGGDPNSPISQIMINSIECLMPNESELSGLSGIEINENSPIDEIKNAMVQYKQNSKIKSILTTLGSRGSIFLDENFKFTHSPAYSIDKSKIIDTTGAGDCFRSAFVVFRSEGNSIQHSLEFASKAAAICIQMKGAMNSMPMREEVEKLRSRI